MSAIPAPARSPLAVRVVPADEHLAWIADQPRAVSFLQTPAWAGVKAEWGHESLGWFTPSGAMVGAALILHRSIPRTRRTLAYIPEGPTIEAMVDRDPVEWTAPLVAHLKARGAFTVKVGPTAPTRIWEAATIKAAIADGMAGRLRDVPADVHDDQALAMVERMQRAGWQRGPASDGGFGDVQPRYVFQLPLAGRTTDEVFAGFNQEWRRNIRKANKSGVEVETSQSDDDLAAFHRVYVETAQRDRFTPRGLPYFQRMARVMRTEAPERFRLFLARHEGAVVAATTMVSVGRHAWYSYGASTTAGRDVRPSNAIQWAMIQAAHADGADVYDLRGISDTLDTAHPLFGLIRFKVGTGGRAVEYAGEFDLPINALLHKAVGAYLARR